MELWTELLKMGFSEIENEVVSRLRASESAYRQLGEQRSLLLQQHPLIQNVSEGNRALFPNQEDFEAWLLSKALGDELDQMERAAIYMQGHADCYSYFKKIGVL